MMIDQTVELKRQIEMLEDMYKKDIADLQRKLAVERGAPKPQANEMGKPRSMGQRHV